jgi:hypothetical protein
MDPKMLHRIGPHTPCVYRAVGEDESGRRYIAAVAAREKRTRGVTVALRASLGAAVPRLRSARGVLSRLPARRRRVALVIGVAALVAGGVAIWAGGGKDGGHRLNASATGGSEAVVRDSEARMSYPESASTESHELAVSPTEASANVDANADTGPSPGAPSDAEVRRELRQLERYKRRVRSGGSLDISSSGQARSPVDAPAAISDVVAGGNAIATFPYRLGGGHGSFVDSAYDCSGSVSYGLAAAGMVEEPLTSGDFMKWGVPGPGRWLTVYANPGHVYMTVGGLRFDTSGRAGPHGSRWQGAERGSNGFTARHWPGL